MKPMSLNYKKQFEWVFKAYEDAGVDLPNGFQKDDIQNHQGARPNNRWNGWKSDISVVTTSKGVFLVCEDFGTVGLTGKNMSTAEISAIVARDENLDSSERLARFSSMNNSGGNKNGGGLYGVGKIVYSVASIDYTYYFDSLTKDGKYVANENRKGQVYDKAFEGDAAKSFILDETDLPEKTTVGTRVIIKNPKPELLEAITSGQMEEYIQESWWVILNRLPEGSAITINGKPVSVPTDIMNTDLSYNLPSAENYRPGYRVKKFGFYLFKDGSNRWSGISYYRKGMKIGEIEIRDLPERVRGKFWGYIEVDEDWEDELSKIEDAVHFGVSKGKKLANAYQYLRNFCSERVRTLLVEWGYIKDQENDDKRLREELSKIAEDVQDLFENLGFEDLGKGPQKSDFYVRWNKITYPVENSLTVVTNDKLSFSVRIGSLYLTNKKFEYSLKVVEHETKRVVSEIDSGVITLSSGEVKELPYVYIVSPDTATKSVENRIVLRVKVVGSGKEKVNELPFFYDCEKPDNSRDNVVLTLHECTFPIEGSRRVNFGDILKNISYRIDNKRNSELHYRLSVSIHNASDPSFPQIVSITSVNGIVAPFEEEIVSDIPDIQFEESLYSQYMSEGILQLRARLIATSDSGEFRKGDKITNYFYDLFLNMDEKNGKRKAFEIKSVEKQDYYKRAWYEKIGNERFIYLNIGHNAYTRISDFPEIQHEYMYEQVMKQYVLLYLSEGKYDMFSLDGENFQELDPVSASERVIEKIEKVFYQSLG